jgi:hypothetical protein
MMGILKIKRCKNVVPGISGIKSSDKTVSSSGETAVLGADEFNLPLLLIQ